MRRMTSNILCSLSLGLCVGLFVVTLCFYMDSYSTCQEAFASRGDHTLWAYSLRGVATFSYDHTSGENGFWRLPGAKTLLMADDVEHEHRLYGFRASWGKRNSLRTASIPLSSNPWGFRIGLPHWFVAILFFIAPAPWLVRYYRHADRRRPGHCKTCGYDLSGTVLAGRPSCPECGHDVLESASAVA